MPLITTHLPIFESGYVVAELTVHVRPCFDMAFERMFGDGYLASDVSFEDSQEDPHPVSDDRKRTIFAEIKRYKPSKWAEIEAAASSPIAA